MKRLSRYIGVLLLLPLFSVAQKITYSDLLKKNSSDLVVEILGKVNGNLLTFENRGGTKHSISIYGADMVLKEKIPLDFIALSKAFNIDFIIYPDFFYIIYQFQKRDTVYYMAAKMDGNAKKINEPITLDTTHVNSWRDVIYNVITSENKQKIMICKLKGKENGLSFFTLLYNDKLQLIHATPYPIDYDLRNNSYSDFQLDNEGNMVFTRSKKLNGSDDLASVDLLIKNSLQDSFSIKNINHGWYNMNIQVDNANKRYLLNSFYYMQPQENIEGIYSTVWDAKGDSVYGSRLNPFPDSIRKIAEKSGEMNTAFNGYSIRNAILKKDGGYILVAEDLFYYNILVCSISNIGVIEWYNIIAKNQSIDLPSIFLHFITFTTSKGVHFLYNSSNKRKLLLLDNTISEDGKITRNPPLKNEENGCDFMIRYAKKTGARELVIPCLHRGKICFAKVDF